MGERDRETDEQEKKKMCKLEKDSEREESGETGWMFMREKKTRDIQTNKDRNREHKRLLGHMLHGLFICQGMFSYVFHTFV